MFSFISACWEEFPFIMFVRFLENALMVIYHGLSLLGYEKERNKTTRKLRFPCSILGKMCTKNYVPKWWWKMLICHGRIRKKHKQIQVPWNPDWFIQKNKLSLESYLYKIIRTLPNPNKNQKKHGSNASTCGKSISWRSWKKTQTQLCSQGPRKKNSYFPLCWLVYRDP